MTTKAYAAPKDGPVSSDMATALAGRASKAMTGSRSDREWAMLAYSPVALTVRTIEAFPGSIRPEHRWHGHVSSWLAPATRAGSLELAGLARYQPTHGGRLLR